MSSTSRSALMPILSSSSLEQRSVLPLTPSTSCCHSVVEACGVCVKYISCGAAAEHPWAAGTGDHLRSICGLWGSLNNLSSQPCARSRCHVVGSPQELKYTHHWRLNTSLLQRPPTSELCGYFESPVVIFDSAVGSSVGFELAYSWKGPRISGAKP